MRENSIKLIQSLLSSDLLNSSQEHIQSSFFPHYVYPSLNRCIMVQRLIFIIIYIIFITKILMSDNNSLAHLLSWVNNEWKIQGNSSVIYDFEQLKKTSFLYELLQRIHPSYFETLNHLAYHFETYYPEIENFLIEIEGKKMKRGFKRNLVQQQLISEIIKLVLYLLLQSTHKTQFINRIFEMPVELQGSLMVELQKIDQSLENYIEIKDILMTVEKLEEENEELKDKLKGTNQVTKHLQETVTETRHENQKIEKEIYKYENEKKVIMEELHIMDMRDYIEIYRSVRQQNQELTRAINQAEIKRKDMETENYSLRDQIGEDCQTITTLTDEIQKIRCSYQQARDEVSNLTISNHNSFEDSVLRENKNINNTNANTRHSIETSCATGSSKILWELDEEEDSECQKLRTYNREIMQKLQNAYQTISQLGDEVYKLKDEKGKLQRKNQFLDKKITDIKKQQSRFMKELRKMGM